MSPSRRSVLTSLGGVLFGGGALVGASSFNASTRPDADMRVVATGRSVALLVGPDAVDDGVVTESGGELRIDFTSSGSAGVQPDATYQIGGIDVDNQHVDDPLGTDGKDAGSGFPSPIGGAGTAQDNAGIIVRNDSSQLLGVTVDFSPDDASTFPHDARLLVVTHDKGSAAGDTDIHARLFDRNGLVASSTSHAYRPVFSGERLGVSLWVYTGHGKHGDQNPDLSGDLTFRADDEGDVTVGSYPRSR